MRRSFLVTAALLGASLSFAAAQDLPPDGGKQDRNGKELAPELKGSPLEVRVFLWDKTKKAPLDLKDWTATLQVESKGGLKKTVPMTLTQPRPDDKMTVKHEGQAKDVEGTNWMCELVVLKTDKKDDFRRNGDPKKNGDFKKDDPLKKDEPYKKDEPKRDDTTPKDGEPDRNGNLPRDDKGLDQARPGQEKPQDKGLEEWKKSHAHAGPYFKADLSAEEMPSPEFTASVVLTHKGETKTVTGFRYPFMMKGRDERKNGVPSDAPKPGDTPGPDRPGEPRTPGTPGTPDKPTPPSRP